MIRLIYTFRNANYLYSYINKANILIYIWVTIAEVISIAEIIQTDQF